MPRVIHRLNPLDPRESEYAEVEANTTPMDYLIDRHGPRLKIYLAANPTILLINGKPILREDWNKWKLIEGDVCEFKKLTGDFGLTTWILIGVAVAGGVYLATKLIKPPEIPDINSDRADIFTFSGKQNTYKDTKTLVENRYGRNRIFPTYGSIAYNRFVDNEQIFHGLFVIGVGNYDVEELSFADTDISEFTDITTQQLDAGAGPVTLFEDLVEVCEEVGSIELYAPDEDQYDGESPWYVINRKGGTTQKIEIDIQMPNGATQFNDDGNVEALSTPVQVTFECVSIDDDENETGAIQTLFTKTYGSTATEDPIRETVTTSVSAARYKVRGFRTSNKNESSSARETIQWVGARAMNGNQSSYQDVTVIAVKAKASNELNDTSQQAFNVVATRKLPTYDSTTGQFTTTETATRNPVWAFANVVAADNGARRGVNGLYWDTLLPLVDLANERGDKFDYSFESESTVWPRMEIIASAFRGVPFKVAGQWTIVRYEVKKFNYFLFNEANINKDSIQYSISKPRNTEYDCTEVTYIDEETFQEESIICALPGSTIDYPQSITLAGITNRNQAYREGLMTEARRRYIVENVKVETGFEGRIPIQGDHGVIGHRLVSGGVNGTVIGQSAQILTLDQDVSFESGKTYRITIFTPTAVVVPPILCTEVSGQSNQVDVGGAINLGFSFTDNKENPKFIFGEVDEEYLEAVIVSQSIDDEDSVVHEVENYDSRVFQFDDVEAPDIDAEAAPVSAPDAPTVYGLELSQLENDAVLLAAAWNPSLGANSYDVDLSSVSDFSVIDQTLSTISTFANFIISSSDIYYVRVRAVGVSNGTYVSRAINIDAFENAPSPVEGLALSSPFTNTTLNLQWNTSVLASSYFVRVSSDATGISFETPSTSLAVDVESFAFDKDRSLQVDVVAKNSVGSAASSQIVVTNPPISAWTYGLSIVESAEDATSLTVDITYSLNIEDDVDYHYLWYGKTSGTGYIKEFPSQNADGTFAEGAVMRTQSPTGSFSAKIAKDSDGSLGTLYFRVGANDIWGTFDETHQSPEVSFTPSLEGFLIAEDGDFILTENSNNIITE